MTMLQIDFTENYTTIWQDEIQSAHWQILQTSYSFYKCLLEWLKTSISVIISDHLRHTKGSIVTFIDQLISDLLSEEVKKCYIWNDGPLSQFKSKFIANAFLWLCEKHSVNIEWYFLQHLRAKVVLIVLELPSRDM